MVSKYAPHAADGAPFVDSRFYSTVSVIRTMETLLGVPPMNNNDAFSSMMSYAVYRGGGPGAVYGGLLESRQWADLYGESNGRRLERGRAAKMDFTPCGPGRSTEAERYSVEGRDGRQAGSGAAAGSGRREEG